MIYADFEAITEKIDCYKPNNDSSHTEASQKHIHCYGKYSKSMKVYWGPDPVKWCNNIKKRQDTNWGKYKRFQNNW